MSSFSLVIEYLTGYSIATDPCARDRAEWPPHPARVFMALAAAHFETDPSNVSQRQALAWLSTLPPPDVAVPQHTSRDVRTVYVPVNDQADGEALLKRGRQPRFFPRVHVGSEPLRQTWHLAENAPDGHLDGLESICGAVTRIGHSSSLVWVRLERNASSSPSLVPDEHTLENGMRIPQAGAFLRLEESFNKAAIEEFGAMKEQCDALKGKAKKQLQEKLDEQFPLGQPVSQRPAFSISCGYRPVEPKPADVPSSLFDPNFIVLRESDNSPRAVGIESTAQVVHSLRNLIMSKSGTQPVPSWVGGHESSGDKLTSHNHMALIPLAFVGSRYADGHLLGIGILLPRDVPYRERSKVLAPVLFDDNSNELKPKELALTLGPAGVWTIQRETGLSPKQTLQMSTYVATSPSWASVTPVLLDRMPKNDRVAEPIAWRTEVAGIIAQSCVNVGLPEPVSVRVEKTPFFRGSLRAMPGQGGFPQLRKGRFQVHVAIVFDRPVQGPVLLGAGRFRGYGLLRPWTEGRGP